MELPAVGAGGTIIWGHALRWDIKAVPLLWQEPREPDLNRPVNRRIVLAARPQGEPQPSDFREEQVEMPTPGDGEILLRTLYLSLDPYMRGRMNAARSYAKPVEIGEVMTGRTIAEVIESRAPSFQPGEKVLSTSGWQNYAVSRAKGLQRLEPDDLPVTTRLGVLGMPGLTAYAGLLNIGKPQPGETLVVAAATGPVGSAVGQIAKIKGARVVGIAGGPEKARALTEEFGLDVGLDHRAPNFAERLAEACPDGIDVYFENVGGHVWTAVFPLLNNFARVPVCGQIAHTSATGLPSGPDRIPELMRAILSKRLTLRGFIVSDFADQSDAFQRDMRDWVRQGRVRYREDIVDGLDNAPAAFIGLLKGRNFGKLIVRVAAADRS
jgi:NADPH-dependent curcumin reductase CurA